MKLDGASVDYNHTICHKLPTLTRFLKKSSLFSTFPTVHNDGILENFCGQKLGPTPT